MPISMRPARFYTIVRFQDGGTAPPEGVSSSPTPTSSGVLPVIGGYFSII
jgi:hypothetical protein